MIANQRSVFAIPDEVAYFNCAYMGPMLDSVRRAGTAAIAQVGQPWQVLADDFFTPAERARALFARLINARPDDVALVPSASYGVSTAARNLRAGPGRIILHLDEEFPSNVYPWHALARRDGAEIRVVARPPDSDWTAAILETLDALGDRVAIAALPACHWTDGSVVDLERVSAALQRIGARLVLDLTQSLGVMPFDVTRVRVDFVASASYKWLLGPYGLGFLYAAPEHHGGEPLEYNWITREGAQDFARLVDYRDSYQPGARRFDMGERSSFVLVPMATAALEQILAWTPAAIAATLAGVTAALAARLTAIGLEVLPDRVRAPHILGVRFPAGTPAGLLETLRRQQIVASVRGRTLRVAPYLHTSATDVDRLVETLRGAIA
jgi:selenocysteine lyase/cysteine desulfurase